LKSIVIIAAIAISLFAKEAPNQFTFSSPNYLANDTEVRSYDSLKSEQESVASILISFKSMIEALDGFEEKYVVVELRNQFRNKYLIEERDIINIDRNLNKAIKQKIDSKKRY
jgi:hypothetical protein